jgi:hypothetical protein
MVVRLTGMLLMVGALVGIAMLLARFAGQKEAGEWSWNPKSIRTNFDPIYTPAELKKLQQEAAERALAEFGIAVNSPLVDPPRDNRPPANNGLPLPFEERKDQPLPEEARGTDQREIWARRDALHAELANGGRQSPPSERLALGVMRKLPRGEQLAARLHRDVYFHGPGQRSIAAYRGRGLAVSGRLFDLYRVTLAQPLVYPDGARVDGYFEGAVAFLGRGVGTEHPIEQRVVLFQCLQLPPELEPYVNTAGVIAQSDKLANEAVMVSLEGAYLRLWVYSREVAPFSTPGKPVLCQAHAPLMLAATLTRSPHKPYEITDELLQQVRDALREDPVFLETEAAYYALLARANDPGDSVEAVPDVGYFDLAGGGGETGPRYRGQGIRIVGMIGDDYVPVILPPNIAGMRRVFRTLLLGDTADFATPKKYLLDMVEPPTGLEPRALVAFNARYYRNVFETKSTRSDVRPLLIARRAVAIQEGKKETEWIYVGAGLTAFLGLFVVVIFFVMSDRRERRRFEAASVELSRKRLEKRGGLKLKPLPGDAPAGQEPPKPDPPAAT